MFLRPLVNLAVYLISAAASALASFRAPTAAKTDSTLRPAIEAASATMFFICSAALPAALAGAAGVAGVSAGVAGVAGVSAGVAGEAGVSAGVAGEAGVGVPAAAGVITVPPAEDWVA